MLLTHHEKATSYATTKPDDNDEAATCVRLERPREQDNQADQDGQEDQPERTEEKGQE
jgi:hypothetical protein